MTLARTLSSLRAKFRHRPAGTLAIAALAAVLVNCYPVIFCGRSLVSPNNGAPDNGGNSLVYDTTPTLPGYSDERIADFHGADTGAILWHDVPNAFAEVRALFQYHELPLWNRYKNCGDPLLAQGISMFGDPLHLIVLFGRGSAWAWDIKFVLAKALFCFGCGLVVFALTRHPEVAFLFTVTSAYCGLFNFIPNHPGYFVFCYVPWILLSAIRALDESCRRKKFWRFIWVLANSACFNAGHVEAAVVCILGLNLLAVVYATLEAHETRARWRALAVMAKLTALFIGLNAPVWLPFLTYLPDSFNLHTDVAIEQFPLGLFAGLFDDAFYHAVQEGPLAQGPGGTMFMLFGLLFALASYRKLRSERFFFLNLIGLVVSAGFIFGYIPVALIEHLPLIRRIGHICADFSYLAIFGSMIACAYGCLALARMTNRAEIWRSWRIATAGLALIELTFFWTARSTSKPADFYAYVVLMNLCVLATVPLYVSYREASGKRLLFGLAVALAIFAPHARFGLYTFGPDRWVLKPGVRARLDYPSEGVEYMKRSASEPFRVTGLAWDFYGGYGAVYGLEDPKGVSALMNRHYNDLCVHYPGVERDQYLIELADPAAAMNLLSMLNVRYLVQNHDDPPPNDLPYRLADKSDLIVFENDSVWPRAFFTNHLQSYGEVGDFASLLQKQGEHPFAAIAELDLAHHRNLGALVNSTPQAIARPATGYRLGANETSFEIEASSPGVAVLSEAYIDQGNTVEVNGVEKEVLRLNEALRGVSIDAPGHYRIMFRYRPPHWWISTTLFSSSVTLSLIFLWRRS